MSLRLDFISERFFHKHIMTYFKRKKSHLMCRLHEFRLTLVPEFKKTENEDFDLTTYLNPFFFSSVITICSIVTRVNSYCAFL
jgi:hypothetical protein